MFCTVVPGSSFKWMFRQEYSRQTWRTRTKCLVHLMPAEVRYVIFHISEAVAAIDEYWIRRKMPLPTGRVVPSLDPTGLASIILTISDADGQVAPTERRVESNELAAALILFCRARKIPLPATAEKSLTVVGQYIGLVLSLNVDDELHADLRPAEILRQSPPLKQS